MATKSETTIKLKLVLPESLYDLYAERAAKLNISTESAIVARLTACREHNAVSGIYINDDQRNQLSMIAGRTIKNADDLLSWARNVSSLNVAGVTVELSERLLTRLDSRRFGLPREDHLRKVVTEELEGYVGMR